MHIINAHNETVYAKNEISKKLSKLAMETMMLGTPVHIEIGKMFQEFESQVGSVLSPLHDDDVQRNVITSLEMARDNKDQLHVALQKTAMDYFKSGDKVKIAAAEQLNEVSDDVSKMMHSFFADE